MNVLTVHVCVGSACAWMRVVWAMRRWYDLWAVGVSWQCVCAWMLVYGQCLCVDEDGVGHMRMGSEHGWQVCVVCVRV